MSYKKVITTEETFEYDYPPTQPMSTLMPMMPPRQPGMLPPPPMGPMVPQHWTNTMPNTSNVDSKMSGTLAGVYTTVKPENTDEGVKMRLSFRDYFQRYNALMRAYVLSLANGTADSATALDKFNTHVADFSKVSGLWLPGGVSVISAFTDLSKSVVDLVNMHQQGIDTTSQQGIVTTKATDFAKALQNISTLIWTVDPMVSLWRSYTDNTMSQLSTRKNKMWSDDLDAVDRSYSDLVTGASGSNGLADVLSYGVMQWTPWRFQ